jgi:hypothetical protein
MTVIQMSQVASRSSLAPENFPDNWQEPESIEIEEEDVLDPISFSDIFTPEPIEQPEVLGDDDGE